MIYDGDCPNCEENLSVDDFYEDDDNYEDED